MHLNNSKAWIHPAVLGRHLGALLNKGAPDVEGIPQCFTLSPIIVPVLMLQEPEDFDMLLQLLSIFIRLPLGLLPVEDRLLQVKLEACLILLESRPLYSLRQFLHLLD